ncbi:MAG: hypothetical protein L0Y71_02800 [Gemmataceae bacterium]|nr:hypothetical protein [Gemmataceae bacterium]
MNADSAPSGSSVLARVVWLMVGPMLLLVLALVVIKTGNGWFTVADMAFLAVLAVTILARWWEFRGGAAKTSTGEAATPAHLRRFVVGALVVGLAGWAVANYLANHWLE